MKPFDPKRVETKVPRGPGKRSVLPRYVAVGNAKKVADRLCVWGGNGMWVFVDLDEDGELIGVEIK